MSLSKAFQICLLISARMSSRFIPSVCSAIPRLTDFFPIADFPSCERSGLSSGTIPSFRMSFQLASNHILLLFFVSRGKCQALAFTWAVTKRTMAACVEGSLYLPLLRAIDITFA
jgi:hypothetical protein